MKRLSIFTLIFLSLLLLLSLQLSSASEYNLELVQYGDKVLEKYSISLDYQQEIRIELPKKYSSLDVKNEYSIDKHVLIIQGKEIEFSFINPDLIEKGSQRFLSFLSEKGKKYYLTKTIKPKMNIDSINLRIVFDEGFVVDEVFPSPTNIETDGKKIIVNWEFKNFKENEIASVFIIFRDVKENVWLSPVLFILIILFLAILILFFIRKKLKSRAKPKTKKQKKKKSGGVITRFLLDNEKKVVEELKGKNGLWQKQLQLRTGFSKVKLSRILKKLEKRGVIKKENFGKTNKIFLKYRKL